MFSRKRWIYGLWMEIDDRIHVGAAECLRMAYWLHTAGPFLSVSSVTSPGFHLNQQRFRSKRSRRVQKPMTLRHTKTCHGQVSRFFFLSSWSSIAMMVRIPILRWMNIKNHNLMLSSIIDDPYVYYWCSAYILSLSYHHTKNHTKSWSGIPSNHKMNTRFWSLIKPTFLRSCIMSADCARGVEQIRPRGESQGPGPCHLGFPASHLWSQGQINFI